MWSNQLFFELILGMDHLHERFTCENDLIRSFKLIYMHSLCVSQLFRANMRDYLRATLPRAWVMLPDRQIKASRLGVDLSCV